MRRFLLRKRVLMPLGSGVLLLLLAYFVLLPWVVRGRVEAVLSQLELRDVTYRVTRATPWSSTIRDIDAGDGNRIDELRVTYSVGGLRNQRVDHIRIRGLHLTAELRDGNAKIDALEPLRRMPAATRESAWPFLGMDVAGSKLIVRTPEGEIPVMIDGELQGRELRLALAPPGATASLTGSLHDERGGGQSVRFDFDGLRGSDLSSILHGISPRVPVRTAGTLRGTGTASRAGDKTSFDVELVAVAPDEAAHPPTTHLAGTNVAVEQGVFHIAGSLGGGDASLNVKARDVTLAETSVGAKASGVRGDVSFVNLSPMTTAPDQVVRVDKLSASKLDLTDGVVQFDRSPDGALNVDEMRWRFLGGELSAKDVRVAPGQPVALTLVASNVELGDLLALLAQGKATGEGKVSGQLPLVITPDGHVTLGEGSAVAVAGGTLSVTDEPTLQSVAGSAASADPGLAARAQAQVRNDIVAALKDFQFESLTARLKSEPDKGLVAHVNMKGKGRTGARQALDYDLRVTGLNDLLRSLVGLQQTVSREAARQ